MCHPPPPAGGAVEGDAAGAHVTAGAQSFLAALEVTVRQAPPWAAFLGPNIHMQGWDSTLWG